MRKIWEGTSHLTNELLLGCAKVDITPEFPLPLAGFGHRKGSFEAVELRLFARLFLFQHVSEGSPVRALLVSADLIWWAGERMEGLRKMLLERWGIRRETVIFSATHTHSGPQTSKDFVPSLGLADNRYIEMLEQKITEGVEEALSNLEPVTISKGTGSCGFGINRRKYVDGRIEMAPNEAGPVDPELGIIRFERKSESSVKAVWMHYTCHPTTTDVNRVSSEFPGVAAHLVEAHLGVGATVAYLQGCCGDIRPALIREGEFFRGDDTHVSELGEALAAETIRILQETSVKVPTAPLMGKQLKVPLPYDRVPDLDGLKSQLEQPGIVGEWSRFLADNSDRLKPHADLELTLLKLSDDLSLLAMNAEMVLDYGLYAKQFSQGRILPLAYSNGMIGYVPTSKQLEEGGYEASESSKYFALPSVFSADIERRIKESIQQIAVNP
jgi:hypothetical protein